MAVDIWCILFFLLNLGLAKQINKEMLRSFNLKSMSFNPLPSKKYFHGQVKDLLRRHLCTIGQMHTIECPPRV